MFVEVNEEGIRHVAWSSNKDGLRYSIWVKSSQREQVVGPSRSWVYHKRRVTQDSYKSGFKSLKWVTPVLLKARLSAKRRALGAFFL